MSISTDIQNAFLDACANHNLVGASLAIRHQGQEQTSQWGITNLADPNPVTPGTRFQIGSITKLMTAAMIMKSVQDGLLQLDDVVAAHLPDFHIHDHVARAQVTIRHCLTHQSGIDGDFFPNDDASGPSVASYISKMSDLPSLYMPGQGPFAYCNAGFVLLGRVLEQLYNNDWSSLVKEMIFDHAKTDGDVDPFNAISNGQAIGHTPDKNGSLQPATANPFLAQSSAPAGSAIYMSASELLQFMTAFASGDLVSPENRNKMWEQVISLPPFAMEGATGWGLGWIIGDHGQYRHVGHSGTTIGQYAYMRHFPDYDFTYVVLTNSPSKQLDQDIYQAVIKALTDTAPSENPQQSNWEYNPNLVTGTYQSLGMRHTITQTDGRLELRIDDRIFNAPSVEATLTPFCPGVFDVVPKTSTPNPLVGAKVYIYDWEKPTPAPFTSMGVRLLKRQTV